MQSTHLSVPTWAAVAIATAALVAWLSWPAEPVLPTTLKQEPAATRPSPAQPVTVPAEWLSPSSPAEVRQLLHFTKTAATADVPTLRTLALRAKNPLAAGNAVRALGRLGALAKDGEVLSLLTDPRPRLRQELVVALGRSRDPSVVPHLADVLWRGDATLRPLALQALAGIPGPEARRTLQRSLARPDATDGDRAFANQPRDDVAMQTSSARTRIR